MTFTEAAVEVLRRAGKPLHYKEIADAALRENLLSHVGQDPEITMGRRPAARAGREADRKVVGVMREGPFALPEGPARRERQVEAVVPPRQRGETGEPLYRPREREPRAIHAQARRRLAELQAEHEEGSEEVEAERRRQDQGRKGQRRFPPPAEVVFEALAQRQTGAVLAELAADLLHRQLLSDALVRDLPSLVAALLEDNRRRTEAGRKPAFIVDGDRVTLVEFPPPTALPEETRVPHVGARPLGAIQLGTEVRRAVIRALRRRVTELDTSAFENLCAALLDRMGMRDVRVAKRSKEGPLYLARQRRGVSDLRVAVKLVRGGREIGRADVQELRKDLAHYSAQMGLVLAPGEAGRDARSEARAAGQAPVALYTGEEVPSEAQRGAETAAPGAEGEEPREARRRRGREERPRATSAAEQAWGQPAGTMRFAPPPGPTVVSATTTGREDSSGTEPAESSEEPAGSSEEPAEAPETQKPDPF